MYRFRPWKKTRFWAVEAERPNGDWELVAIVVYKRGAKALVDRLTFSFNPDIPVDWRVA